MKTLFSAALALSLAVLASSEGAMAQTSEVSVIDSLAFATAKWNVTKLPKGAEMKTAHIPMFGGKEFISVYSYPMKRKKTEIVEVASPGLPTSEIGLQKGADAVINAGYFNKSIESDCFLRLDGKHRFVTEEVEYFRVNGMITVEGRKVSLCSLDENYKGTNALGAGPLLISNGERIDYPQQTAFYLTQHPRTVVGIDQDKNRVYFIVIDGRAPGQAAGASIKQTTAIALWLGLEDALNLDGGGSSSLWVKGEGIVSHPSDNKKFDHEGERKVPTALIAR